MAQKLTQIQVYQSTHTAVKKEADRQKINLPEMYQLLLIAGLPLVKKDYDQRTERLTSEATP